MTYSCRTIGPWCRKRCKNSTAGIWNSMVGFVVDLLGDLLYNRQYLLRHCATTSCICVGMRWRSYYVLSPIPREIDL